MYKQAPFTEYKGKPFDLSRTGNINNLYLEAQVRKNGRNCKVGVNGINSR